MKKVLSIRAAAELCGVGEPAIRRAIREGRIVWACHFWEGTMLMDYDSVMACYPERFDKARKLSSVIIQVPDGPAFELIDVSAPFLWNPYLPTD